MKDALRDELVSGLINENIRQKLLSEELDFDKAMEFALRLEQAEKQSSIFAGPQPHGEVLKINVKKSSFSENCNTNKTPGNKKCFRCDAGDHFANSCPNRNVSCHLYRQVGHLV